MLDTATKATTAQMGSTQQKTPQLKPLTPAATYDLRMSPKQIEIKVMVIPIPDGQKPFCILAPPCCIPSGTSELHWVLWDPENQGYTFDPDKGIYWPEKDTDLPPSMLKELQRPTRISDTEWTATVNNKISKDSLVNGFSYTVYVRDPRNPNQSPVSKDPTIAVVNDPMEPPQTCPRC